jgi:phosphoribosylaminoimidazole-succinocarboxamide synthase
MWWSVDKDRLWKREIARGVPADMEKAFKNKWLRENNVQKTQKNILLYCKIL